MKAPIEEFTRVLKNKGLLILTTINDVKNIEHFLFKEFINNIQNKLLLHDFEKEIHLLFSKNRFNKYEKYIYNGFVVNWGILDKSDIKN